MRTTTCEGNDALAERPRSRRQSAVSGLGTDRGSPGSRSLAGTPGQSLDGSQLLSLSAFLELRERFARTGAFGASQLHGAFQGRRRFRRAAFLGQHFAQVEMSVGDIGAACDRRTEGFA